MHVSTGLDNPFIILEGVKSKKRIHHTWTDRDKRILNSARTVWEDIKKAPIDLFKKFIEIDIKNESTEIYIRKIDIESGEREQQKICLHLFESRIKHTHFFTQEQQWKSMKKETIKRRAAWQNILGLYGEMKYTFSTERNPITLKPNQNKLSCLEEIAKALNIDEELSDNGHSIDKTMMSNHVFSLDLDEDNLIQQPSLTQPSNETEKRKSKFTKKRENSELDKKPENPFKK